MSIHLTVHFTIITESVMSDHTYEKIIFFFNALSETKFYFCVLSEILFVLFHFITWQVRTFPVYSSERQDMKDKVFPAIWGICVLSFKIQAFRSCRPVAPYCNTKQGNLYMKRFSRKGNK
jgi:hypothetical protein